MNIPRIETPTGLTVFFQGETHTKLKSAPDYADFVAAVEGGDEQTLIRTLGIKSLLKSYTGDKFEVKGGTVVDSATSAPVHPALRERIVELFKAGKSFDYLLNFLTRLRQNPNPSAVEELYLFLQSGSVPLTPEGFILAYRKVDDNYMSFHANPDGSRNRNMVGDVVEMKREDVDGNREVTCSKGLHFCSFSYLNQYHSGQGRVMIVEIDPADVVSIPSDYSNCKGRTCRYKVVAEHLSHEKAEAFKGVPLANRDGSKHDKTDISIIKPAAPGGNKYLNRIVAYVERAFSRRKKPTLRQVQSVLSPNTPTIGKVAELVTKAGFVVEGDRKNGVGNLVVTETSV